MLVKTVGWGVCLGCEIGHGMAGKVERGKGVRNWRMRARES
jgi:hypothetical protein